jgi:hypothetical protein
MMVVVAFSRKERFQLIYTYAEFKVQMEREVGNTAKKE